MLASFESFCNFMSCPQPNTTALWLQEPPKPSTTRPLPPISNPSSLAYQTQNLTKSHLKSHPARPNSISFLSFPIAGLYITLALVFSFV